MDKKEKPKKVYTAISGEYSETNDEIVDLKDRLAEANDTIHDLQESAKEIYRLDGFAWLFGSEYKEARTNKEKLVVERIKAGERDGLAEANDLAANIEELAIEIHAQACNGASANDIMYLLSRNK